ncbi:hypothetical protein FACS189496_2860 [Bacilli bacterium]|nr:hypothetical protein FACS189496_2860 [Bacilli bacterium]
MIEAEAGKLERLCNGFSALTDENKLAALAVSKALLTFRRSGAAPEDKGQGKKMQESGSKERPPVQALIP